MEEFNKDMLRKLAHNVMFDLNDQELEKLALDFKDYLKQLDLLNKIDTEGVEEMVYPFETPTTILRNDEESHVLSASEALANAPKTSQGYIVVPKVVK